MRTIKVSRWIDYQWDQFLTENNPEVHPALIDADLTKEVFARLFAPSDSPPLTSIRPEDEWLVRAHNEMAQSESFTRLQARAQGDRYGAGVAATRLAAEVMGAIDTFDAPMPKHSVQHRRDQVRGMLDWAKALKDGGVAEDKFPTGLMRRIEKVKALGKEAAARWKEYNEGLDDSTLITAVATGVGDANKAMDVDSNLSSLCGWDDSAGAPSVMDPALRAELAERVRKTPKLAEIAKQAGRLRQIASGVQRMKPATGCEVTSIECGNDVSRLLPTELVKLTDPALMLDFSRGYLERSLLQYEVKGKVAEGRGPIVVCLDSSGSMGGEREVWSKAIALALLSVARKQKRSCRVIHFDCDIGRVDDFDGKASVDANELLDSMCYFSGGGTDFEGPLREAHEAIAKESGLRKADVVFITDGICKTKESFRSWWATERERLGFNVFGIHVGAPGGVASKSLGELSDKVVGVADIANDAVVHDVFSL